MALLGIAVLVRTRWIGVLRLDPVILHHPCIAPVELLQVAHVVYRARQAVGAVLGRYCSQLPDRVLPSFAEALQALRIADCPRLPVRVRQCNESRSSPAPFSRDSALSFSDSYRMA